MTLIGPDDPHPEVDDERLRILLREIFHAASGAHDDLAEYDRVMRTERRVAVLITPERFTTNCVAPVRRAQVARQRRRRPGRSPNRRGCATPAA